MSDHFKDLLVYELQDILSAEVQLVKALPAIVTASEAPNLKEAFKLHLKESKGQVQRLEKAFRLLKVPKKATLCKAMKGLIDEGKDVLKKYKKRSALRDAALISKAQRIEHYEISAYGTVRTFAKEIGLHEVADLLQASLDEESSANKQLSKIAEGGLLSSGINAKAKLAADESPKTQTKKTSSSKKLTAASTR